MASRSGIMPNRLLPARMARSAAVPTVLATIPFADIGHHVMVDTPERLTEIVPEAA